MGKLAFLYPGQGSQKVGMGSDLRTETPELFARYFEACEQCAGLALIDVCLHGPIEELSQTQVAQPALFAHSLALTAYARELHLLPDLVAGHSLGEYTAAVVAGALSFEAGLVLVCERGRLMSQIQQQQPGAMAAIIGLEVEPLQELCHSLPAPDLVVIANWNAPTQLVISGLECSVQKLMHLIRTQTQAKVIRLPTRGGFHSPLMFPVQQKLQEYMQQVNWHDGSIPMAINVSGQLVTRGADICQALLAQITSPVRWVACIETLIEQGCDTFLELGSGQVLSKLVRQIAPGVTVFAADTPTKLRSFVESYPHVLTTSVH